MLWLLHYCTGLGAHISHVLPLNHWHISLTLKHLISRFVTKQYFLPAKPRLDGGTLNLSCVRSFSFSLVYPHECQDNTLKQVKRASFHISAHAPSFNWLQTSKITAPKLPKILPLHIPHTLSTTLMWHPGLKTVTVRCQTLTLSNAKGYKRMELCLHKEAKPHIWL